MNSIYEENIDFLHSLLLEAISLIVNTTKQNQEEDVCNSIKQNEEKCEEVDHTVSPSLLKEGESEHSLPSLDYQFENFEKQIQTMKEIINNQSQELNVQKLSIVYIKELREKQLHLQVNDPKKEITKADCTFDHSISVCFVDIHRITNRKPFH